jgi:hypothetical protein
MLSKYWWVHLVLEVVGVAIALGIAWGIFKTRLNAVESKVESLTDNEDTFVKKEDCFFMREDCQKHMAERTDSFEKAMKDVGTKVESSINNNTSKWQQVATVLGAICQKLEIPLPKWK